MGVVYGYTQKVKLLKNQKFLSKGQIQPKHVIRMFEKVTIKFMILYD